MGHFFFNSTSLLQGDDQPHSNHDLKHPGSVMYSYIGSGGGDVGVYCGGSAVLSPGGGTVENDNRLNWPPQTSLAFFPGLLVFSLII